MSESWTEVYKYGFWRFLIRINIREQDNSYYGYILLYHAGNQAGIGSIEGKRWHLFLKEIDRTFRKMSLLQKIQAYRHYRTNLSHE